jgi:hypothetical protein
MRDMDPHTVLACWDHGRLRHPLDRALLLHAMAAPAEDATTLADRPLGVRNAALLRLHDALAGDELQSSVDCPECHERLEFTLSAAAMCPNAASPPSQVTVGDVLVRVPTTRDLASLAGETDLNHAADLLLKRLVPAAPAGERGPDPPHLDAVMRALDEADPCADLTVALTCPACAHAWDAALDIAAFVWEEIDVRARRVLDEVHVLAQAYGWTETEILRLSDARRSAYIDRVLG